MASRYLVRCSLPRPPTRWIVHLKDEALAPACPNITRSYFNFPEKEDHRIRDIIVHPKSVGSEIKPGNLVDKYFPITKNTRTVPTDVAKGYFWMVGDLKETDNKPTLANEELTEWVEGLSGLRTIISDSVYAEMPLD